jgi:hypothetical protein
MLKEFKRDAMKKELEQLSELLADKKQSLQNLFAREEQSVELFKKAEELGITKEEVFQIMEISCILRFCSCFLAQCE